MAILVTMPSLSPTMESGAIAAWRKQVGDAVEPGEVLAEIETDKAVMDFEVADEGILRAILIEPGEEISVGTPIAILADSLEEDISGLLTQAGGGAAPAADSPAPPVVPAAQPPAPAPAAAPPAPAAAAPAAQAAATALAAAPPDGRQVKISPYGRKLAEEHNVDYSGLAGSGPAGRIVAEDILAHAGPTRGGRIKISPYGRKLARENHIDPALLTGSGPEGRIVARDVEAAIAAGAAQIVAPAAAAGAPPALAVVAGGEAYEDLPLSMMRKAIARKMEESKQTVPHFQATRKVRMERMMTMRGELKRDFPDVKISINDLIVKACAVALKYHPMVNSQYLGDRIRRFHTIDLSVAVATDEGLITPIIRGADRKSVPQIAGEIRELAGRAREKRLAPEEYTGGTFTVSNLGMFGIDEFNGIINTPQACLLAVSAVVTEPVVEGDAVVPGQTMNMTLSSDHRIVDGATAAQFLQTLSTILENPLAMVM